MRQLSDYTSNKHADREVVLGRSTPDNGYCCTNIGMADVFLMIMPKLKECFDSELLQLKNNPLYSNEMSPAAVTFKGSDGKTVATYRRESIRKMPAKLTPFGSVQYINVPVHNTVTFGDSRDTRKFIEKCKEFSNGVLDFDKYLN